MKKLTCIAVLFITAHIFAKDFATVENGGVKTEIWMPKTSVVNNANANNENQIYLSFFGNFHDTAVVFLNTKQIYRGYLNTDGKRRKRTIGLILEIDPNIK